MRFSSGLKFGVWIVAACLSAYAQDAPAKDAPAEIKGLPPRVAPTDYQAHGQAGTVTIAAEFRGHAVPTMQGTLTTEDYVTVEIGLFGPADARMKISAGDFSLRVNDKKTPLDSQPYGLVIGNVKDPEWEPPPAPAKSKTSLGGDGGEQSNQPPRPVKPAARAARDGPARSEIRAARRRPRPPPGRTALLLLSRQAAGHPHPRTDLLGQRGQTDPQAPALKISYTGASGHDKIETSLEEGSTNADDA